ncbi:MAG TPA: HAMP domain-containing protein, partial [Ktedonobacteraceae bacterium]
MKVEEKTRKPAERKRQRNTLKLWSRLQMRMTISYVGVSVVIVLLVEFLLIVIFFVVLSPFIDQNFQGMVKKTAQDYAKVAAAKGGGVALDPQSTFQQDKPSSLVLPGSEQVTYIEGSSTPQNGYFALLLAPNGQILASSYPVSYPVSASAARLLPDQKQLILNALSGRGGSTITITAQGHIISAAEPVLSNERKPIGAIYVQGTSPAFNGDFLPYIAFFLVTALFWIIVTAPIGALFGVLTTRGLVRRLHRLVSATAQFANDDYTQRVPVTRQDEIGQLESQFNQMAEKLVQSMTQRQALIEQ